jgi:PKD repeat protein
MSNQTVNSATNDYNITGNMMVNGHLYQEAMPDEVRNKTSETWGYQFGAEQLNTTTYKLPYFILTNEINDMPTFTIGAGVPAYTYQWYLNGNAVSGATNSTYTTSFASSGSNSIYVILTDGAGNTVQSSTLTETVNSAPSVSINVEYSTVYTDTNDTFTASGTYGTGSYNYTWSVGSTVIGYGHSILYNWTSTGTYVVSVELRDSLGETANAQVTITVVVHPEIYISGPLEVTEGQTNTWSMVVSNVTINGNVAWYNDGTNANDANPFFTYAYPVSNVNESIEVSYYVQGKYYNSTIYVHVYAKPTVSISTEYLDTDTGIPDKFTGITSGGTPGFSYSWTINGQLFNSQNVSFVFSNPGTYAIKLTATDGDGVSVSTQNNVTVNADPNIIISSSQNPTDIGNSVTFTVSETGGTGTLTYQWYYGNGTAISGATSSTYVVSFNSAGIYSYSIKVKDSVGYIATYSYTETVNSDPSVSISTSQNPTDVGNSITFTASGTGGTGAYSYLWTINGGSSVSTSSTFSYSFISAGTYTIKVQISDVYGDSATATLNVTVNSDPTVTAIASHTQIDLGATETFTASASGGYGSYSYKWVLNGNSISTTSSFTYVFNSVGNSTVEVILQDGTGHYAYANVTVDVVSQPVVSISAEYSSVDTGVQDTFTSMVQYGTGPYNYTWSVNSQILVYNAVFSYVFASSQIVYVNLTVKDTYGFTSTVTQRVLVVPAPSVTIFANRTAIDQGMSISFTSAVQHGVGPYNFTWEINGGIIGYGSSFDYVFSTSNIYTVTLVVKDSFGETAKSNISVTVNKPLTVSATVKYSSIDEGQTDTFSGIVSGGTGPYYYSWSIGTNVVGSSQNLSYPFSVSGTYTVTFAITDSFGYSRSYSLSITVAESLSAQLNLTYRTLDQNITDNITLSGFNGTSPYTYSILLDGIAVTSSDSYAKYFTDPGVYYIIGYVNDSRGESIRLQSSITVRQNPSVYIVPSTNETDVGMPIQFRGILSGGTGPYNYIWLISGKTYNNVSLAYVFESPGKYVVQLTITDVFGREAIYVINETIYSDPVAQLISPKYIMASVDARLSLNITGGIAPYNIQWYFPSGEQLSGNNISHAFSTAGLISIKTEITDSSGYILIHNFTVNVHLFVAIAANETSGITPLSVQFSSSVLGGSGYAYNWSFGNGHFSLLQNPSYVFPTGNYSINLTVTSSNGANGSANISIQSLPIPVSFKYSTKLNITQTFHFVAIPNFDAAAPYNVTWLFPNGQTITGMNISYKFPVYNEFNTVVATFTYNNGKTWVEDLTVQMIPAVPSLLFSIPRLIPVDTMLSLNATATAPDSDSFTYTWDIGGSSQTGQTQLYYFNHVGNFTISVTVVDGLGASATVVHSISVLALQTNSTIAISYSKVVKGPMNYFTIRVLSTNGIAAIEATLNTNQLTISPINSTYAKGGELAYYNLTLDERNYAAGTYPVDIVVFNNNSQSNHITLQFVVTSQYSSSTFSLATIIAYFGGLSNFIIIILTISGVVVAYLSLRREDNPDVIVEGQTQKGKNKKIVLKGKK